jgi:diamine N-acetyltransferase
MIQIRTASREDIDLLTQIGRRAFYEAFAPHNTETDMQLYLSANLTKEKLQEEFGEQNAHFYIAEFAAKPAGYLKLRTAQEPIALTGRKHIEMERIYVLSEFQGRKIGNELMAFSIELARQQGYEILWLGVWEHNYKAIAFYHKWGFEIFGSHSFVLGTDHQTDYLMKLELRKTEQR